MTGRVIGAHGLTLRPTPHTIHVEGSSPPHTWCGFDVIGIPAALQLDAVALTSCPHCQATLPIQIRAGRPDDRPQRMVWLPASTGGNLLTDFCSHSNVFCCTGHVHAWRPQGHLATSSPSLRQHPWANEHGPTPPTSSTSTLNPGGGSRQPTPDEPGVTERPAGAVPGRSGAATARCPDAGRRARESYLRVRGRSTSGPGQ